MSEFSYWDVAESTKPHADSGAYENIAHEASKAATASAFPPDDFRWAMRSLFNANDQFPSATNNYKLEPEKRLHWHNRFYSVRLGKKAGEPEITQELLSAAAYEYLKGGLRVPSLDRGLIDSLIAQETFAYIDRRAGGRAMLTQFGCFGIVIFGGVIWDLVFRQGDSEKALRGLGMFLAVALVVWAWPWRGPYALHRAMRDTYQLLTGSVVSVGELRRRVERARDKGVVWPPELYAVLDDVEGRTKVL